MSRLSSMAELRNEGEPRSIYGLGYAPDGTSFTVRENLVDILERELLGPIHGPDELIPFSPRSQYLVGHIAPVKLSGEVVSSLGEFDDDGNLIEKLADEVSITEGRGVPSAANDDFAGDAEEDDTHDRAPAKGLMIPASMGLRFQVPADLDQFVVTTSWGTYSTVETDQVSKSGHPIRHYQRAPAEEIRTIALSELSETETTTVPLRDSACLRIDRYGDNEFGRVLIEIALCNDRQTPIPIPINMWMFQTKIHISADGEEVLLPVRDVMEQDWEEHDPEVRRLDLQYSKRLEYAIGRTCSVDWKASEKSRRASEVWTTWLPQVETPQTKAQGAKETLLSMNALAKASAEEVSKGLNPLLAGYQQWLDEQEYVVTRLPVHLRETAEETIHEARQVHGRLEKGLKHVATDTEALRCFRFMNRVMRDQRIASQVAAERSSAPDLSAEDARAIVEARGEEAAAWRQFQLAFILMQLPALTDPAEDFRSAEYLARVELLFFPTGGGKTEAYLGLAAYCFAVRRRQGIVQSTDGPLSGADGVTVLMRYTLRLLTTQQFQRATALVCAAELARREDEETWGSVPFRIGLWVGTDVSPKRYQEAEDQLVKANQDGAAHRLTLLQLQRCPWCGTPITSGDAVAARTLQRIFVYCGDDLARCPFSKGGAVEEGLPVLTIDEEIYRLTPALVIGTVDKFARLAREGEAAALFGYVGKRCSRHGYVHPDFEGCSASKHNAKDDYPAATVAGVSRLRPPDLIIQDELHLITGSLGTSVGLFEAVVETLCSWDQADEKPVRPLIVASTATVRNAKEQVRGLYGREVEIFPPQVLDVADTYFSKEVPISEKNPGRRYLGVSAQGVRLSSAEIRVAQVLLSAGQLLMDKCGEDADPYMTLVGYFNATRELAGMARYMADDVQNRVKRPQKDSGFVPRVGAYGALNVGELTSRISSRDIGKVLDQLSLEFDPAHDTTKAVREKIEASNRGEKVAQRTNNPFDVVLATSMLQVGVDVQRLGLMLVVGQPKNTAEYIQASSRVGRDESERPGLVVSLGNWARPRDLAHFEQFRHYHETFYSQVEALSVTPYSPTSLERGIDGMLVSAARVAQAPRKDGLSPEQDAWRIEDERSAVENILERLERRIAAASQSESVSNRASELLANRVDRWAAQASQAIKLGQTLVYERTRGDNKFSPLMISPENARSETGSSQKPPFEVANSMREVQPEINVLVSPLPDRLFAQPPDDAPKWQLPSDDGEPAG
jgi:hypothetical protein